MSDLEKTGGAGKSLVMVEQTEDNDHKPYRPTKLEESSSTDQHHKLSTVPAIIPSAENLKEVANASSVYMKPKLSETETDMSSKNKKLRKQHEKSKSPIETIALERIEVDVKGPGENFSPMPVLPTTSVTADIKSKEISAKAAKEKLEKSFDDDSIIEQAPEPEASPASKRSRELLQSDYNKRKLVTCLDEAGAGLLHKAIYYDYMDIAEWLVSNYPQLVYQRDSLGRTPLHYTANCRKAGLAAALLEGAGAARGARDAAGRSPAQYRAAPAAIALPQPDMPPQRVNNPPGLVIKRHNIRIWCHDCDMARLQRVVWEGHGKALLSEVSNQPVVKRFLEAVPYIMNTIRDIHNAVIENDLEGLMKYSGDPVPPQILSSRDVNNMTVMHKAAGLGHGGILGYIAERYPQGINDIDNDGRTPLHYAAAVRDEQHIYNTLVSLGADEGAMDNKNKPPGYYINKPHEIDKNLFKTLPDAPRTPSSAYPTSWDWKILDTEPIVESNKKTRRKTKASDNSISKNNTNSISESTTNRRGMKGSSTQEFIKELPDLDDKLTKPNGNVDNKDSDVVEENSDETDKDTQQLDETSDQKEETVVETEENDESQEQPELQQENEETDDHKSIEHQENSETNDVQEENTKEESEPSDEKDSDEHNENENNEKVELDEHNAENPEPSDEKDSDEHNENESNEKVELDEHNAENPAEENNDESKIENEAVESDKDDQSEQNDGEPENNESHKPSDDTLEENEKESSNKDNAEHKNTDNEEDNNENSEEEQEKIVDYSNGNNHNHHINGADTNENTTHKTENTQHEHENGTQSSNIIVYEHPNTTQERNMIRDYSNPNITEKMSKANDDNKTGQIDEQSEDDDDVQVQGDIHPDSSLPSINASEVKKIGSAKRLNTTVSSGNASDGRYSQDSLIEGIISGDAEQDTQDASITQKDETVHGEMYNIESEIDPEVADLINTANMEMLATLVLNGEGSRLVGRRSYNAELQAFLDNVPMYMQKINKVHIAAREGNIRDLQAALDRRKFAIARDPISPNGATPLHVATIFGKTNIMKYLGGRFPETLSAVDFEGRAALHYAAVLPDNGHYYNLLQQLGANVKDLDDNGKSAEDYYNDPSLLPYTQLFAEYGISDEAAENMFSDKGSNNAANGRVDTPVFNTDEGRYLAKSLGDPLIKGLTEVANVKPKDPVAFLASFLHNFPEHEKPRLGTQESKAMVTHEQPEVENEVPAPTVAVAVAAQPQVSRSAARTATRPHRPIDVVTVDPQVEVSPDAPEAASSSVDRDEHGQSMLHFAAARKHTNNALFQLIQESDISLGYRDELYRTARDVSIQANIAENTEQIDRFVLHLAARGNTREIMELLLEGYDHILDVVDDEEVPITDVIAQRGNTEMSNLLASIPAFEESRETLHNAIRRGDLVTVQNILSAEGGRTLARAHNTFSRTALHVAVLAQHEDIVAYLVQTFPELLKIGDNLERTPLHYAMGVEKMESLSRLLIRAGAKRVLKDLKGRQPTYYFMNKSDILRLKEEEEVY